MKIIYLPYVTRWAEKLMLLGGLPIIRCFVMKTFIKSQFNYCPLISMLHSRTINNKINRLHERALRIVHSDFKSSFEGLLVKGNSFSIHERNIQSLAIEIYKFLDGLSPSFLNNVFHKSISNSYDLRNHKELYSKNSKTVAWHWNCFI